MKVMQGRAEVMWGREQEWLAREDGAVEEAGRHAAAATPCLFTRTPSLEQAGGLQRMTLRGHTGGISKVLLTPGGIDVITGVMPNHAICVLGFQMWGHGPTAGTMGRLPLTL